MTSPTLLAAPLNQDGTATESAPAVEQTSASSTAVPRTDNGKVAAPSREAAAEKGKPGARSAAAAFLLLTRADALLVSGDISGARLVLEHAVGTGSARAAFLLAETYDPNVLTQHQVPNLKADTAKARELYERARKGGIKEADERIVALK
jgi:TPR repeat protein